MSAHRNVTAVMAAMTRLQIATGALGVTRRMTLIPVTGTRRAQPIVRKAEPVSSRRLLKRAPAEAPR